MPASRMRAGRAIHAAREIDHRRNENGALEPALAGMHGPQHDRAAHRVGQCEMGLRTIRKHHLLHEGLEVDLVLREVFDMALARIRQLPGGMPLPPPVHGRDRKAALAQFADRLEIFLDELAAAAEDADRPFARPANPSVRSATRSVRCPDRADDGPVGNGIAGMAMSIKRPSSGRLRGRSVLCRRLSHMPPSDSTPPIR